MKTIIHLDNTKISPLIFLSSRAILSTDDAVASNPWDSNYRFETILLSGDERIKSHNYCWGTSNDYFKSFHLFQFTSWIHKRLLKRIRHRLKRANSLEKLEAELLAEPEQP